MDILLSKVTQQAMNYAIRSGITLTASYAIRQSSRLLKVRYKVSDGGSFAYHWDIQTVEGNDREELQTMQERLESKIRVSLKKSGHF